MAEYGFDGDGYAKASGHQKEWGGELIAEFCFQGDERILDIGCGDGALTARLAALVPDGAAVGLDASRSMIETARRHKADNLHFVHEDVQVMEYQNEFDVLFSNAALHWILDQTDFLRRAFRALKAGGVILWDFAGEGNCTQFFEVVQETIELPRYRKWFDGFAWPWFMPSKETYAAMLFQAGFAAIEIDELKKDRCFNESALVDWIDQPCLVLFIGRVPDDARDAFRKTVIDETKRRTACEDGFRETFRRLRVRAVKPR